jgi:hypothetical protein
MSMLAARVGALLVAGVVAAWALFGTGAPARQQPRDRAGLPTLARGPISAALGADQPAYRIAGMRAHNAAQGLSARFDPAGVEVASGATTFQIRLGAIGRGRSLQLISPVSPRLAASNRVSYTDGAVTEWWANGPLGLEQGFDLARRPAGVGTLTVELGLSAGTATKVRDGEALLPGGLRYGGVAAVDASGRELRASLARSGGSLVLQVDDQGARYPVRVDPFVQAAALSADDAQESVTQGAGCPGGGCLSTGEFGAAIAVSDHTIVVGAPAHDVGPNANQGAVYVFTEPASGWANATQTAELTAAGARAGDALGTSVAISGLTIVAGAPGGGADAGAAYVFVEPPTGWRNATQTAKLTESGKPGRDGFGSSVAVSGPTIVVGAPNGSGATGDSGAAFVFSEPLRGWSNSSSAAELTASDGNAGDTFGWSVGVSGATAVVGAPNRIVGSNADQGTAYVFTESPVGWSNEHQSAELTASDGLGTSSGSVQAGDELGYSVAISGNTIVAGAPNHQPGATNYGQGTAGAVYVFTQSNSGWIDSTQTAELTASDGQTGGVAQNATSPPVPNGSQLGTSVSVSGNTIVAGAPNQVTVPGAAGAQNSGAAYVFIEPAAGWHTVTQTQEIPGAGEGEGYDAAVAVFADVVAVSGPNPTLTYPAEGVLGQFVDVITRPGPSVSISSPVNGARYATGQRVKAEYECDDSPAGAGLASCAAPAAYNAQIDTSTVGPHEFTVTATDEGGGTASSTVTYTVVAAPAIDNLRQLATSWHSGPGLPKLTGVRSRRRWGTTFSLTLTQAATVTFTFTRKVGTGTVTVGSFTFAAKAGRHRVGFFGSVSRVKTLRPGPYKLTVTALNAAGTPAAPKSIAFTILP